MAIWLARIHHPDWGTDYLELQGDWTFHAVGTSAEQYVESANLDASMHAAEYSPAHGQPGARLAHDVAQMIPSATVELPPPQDDPPGTVY